MTNTSEHLANRENDWASLLKTSFNNARSGIFLSTFMAIFLPITIQAMMASSRTVVDVLMTSSLGVEEVAVVGYGSRIVFILILLVLGVCNGAGVVIAQYFGGGHKDRAITGIGSALLVSFAIAAVGVLMVFLASPVLARLAGENLEMRQLALDYILPASAMVLPFSLSFALAVGLRSIGWPKLATWATVIGLLSNIVLNYMLIFGNWGAPAMGVKGAAYASVISAAIETVVLWLCVKFYFDQPLLRLRAIPDYLNRDLVSQILKIGIPISIGSVIWAIGIFMYSLITAQAGAMPLATLALVTPVESMAIAVLIGLSSSANVLVGHHLGRGALQDATVQALSLIMWTVVITAMMSGIIFALKPWIFSIYSGVGPEVLHLANGTFNVLCLVLFFRALNVTIIVGALRAGGDTSYPIFMDVVAQWLVAIPLAYVGVAYFQLPFPLIFLAINCEEIVKLMLAYRRFAQRKWLRQIKPQAEVLA